MAAAESRAPSGIRRGLPRGAGVLVPAAILLFLLVPAGPARACPFCPSLSPTLSEQYSGKTAAALASWSSAVRPATADPGSTTFELLQVSRGKTRGLKPGSMVTVTGYRDGEEGDLYLLWGGGDAAITWAPPVEFSETAWYYLTQSPSRQTPVAQRLRYYRRFLEFPDTVIAEDAYQEFAAARFEDVAAIQGDLSAGRLREIVSDETVPEQRLGLYGMLLGLCGGDEAAGVLRKRILRSPGDDAALGLDGVLGGYLLLEGEAGLTFLEQQLLKPEPSTFARRLALLRALDFIWTYTPDRISRDRLRQTVRLLLDSPETAERAVITLARWQDWGVLPRLMRLAFDEDFGTPRDRRILRKVVIRYLLAAERAAGEAEPADQKLAQEAKQGLDQIRQRDPATWQAVSRFLRLPEEQSE